MMIRRQFPMSIVLSDRLYRLLLWLYPADHRDEYGPLMAQVFRDQCRAAYQRGGASRVVWLWFPLLIDLTVTLLEEHRRKGYSMSKATLVRYCGPLLMLGGLSWVFASISQLQPGSHWDFWGIYMLSFILFVPALLLTGVGLIGVQARYGAASGWIGQLALTLAIIGGVVGGLAWFLMPFEWGWGLLMLSILVHFISLVVFGLIALLKNVLRGWNWLPIVIGLVPLISLALAPREGNAFGPQWGAAAMMIAVGVGWLAFGYGVHADRRQEQPVPA
jgi:hypothetical protein